MSSNDPIRVFPFCGSWCYERGSGGVSEPSHRNGFQNNVMITHWTPRLNTPEEVQAAIQERHPGHDVSLYQTYKW